MPSDREREWLEDILEAIQLIEKFVKGMELADFQNDIGRRENFFYPSANSSIFKDIW